MHTRQDNAFGILMYHRVAPRIAGVPAPTWNVTPQRLRQQLEGLLSRGYEPWPLRRAVACRQAGEPIPPRTFVVTFDDGYQSVYDNAWPILKELSVSATVFLTTSFLDADRPFASDDWAAAGSADVPASTWKALSTAQCAEMIEHGLVEVGSHMHTHADFRGQPEAFRADLALSLAVLRDSLGVEQPSFAFPFGYHDPDLIAAARDSGLFCALITEPELVLPQANPFSWGRFLVKQSDTSATLLLKLTGWYTVLRNSWRWLRRPWHTDRSLFGRKEALPHRAATHISKRSKSVSP
jgi:peptidoglycan/xylan/chitin deacetylase (PgdA/CDA1 family)